MCSFQLFFIISFDFIFCILDLTAVKEIVNKVKKIFEMDTRLALCSEGLRQGDYTVNSIKVVLPKA